MENNNINDLIEEGKKHLAELQVQIEKLADTAGKAAGIGAEEFSKKADEIIKEAAVHVETAKSAVEAKTKEVMATDEYKNLETEGKKAVDDAQVKIADLAKQANVIADEFGNKLRDIFGKK
jgi:ElaB/YqjD/DUF883 family membrane-anchored ribosome-binding protein